MSASEITLDFNILKSSVSVYKVRKNKSDSGWADITLDANGNKGRLSISSDYGNWAYYWGSCGCSFKKFLCGLDIGYVAGKFGEDRWFDNDATIRTLKKCIIDWRKEDVITAKEARSYFDVTKELEECNQRSYYEQIYMSSELTNFGQGYPDIITGISPTFERFWNTTWAYFIEQLKEEF